ncbi:MAG: hypothetical protein HY791_01180 [Deltaproteobacteria bacterium]|nr:hypothetical protein [Deltaproteobacteria bacterium]
MSREAEIRHLEKALQRSLASNATPTVAIDLATSAGLLSRLSPGHPLLGIAEGWIDGPGSAAISEAIQRFSPERQLRAFERASLELGPEERSDLAMAVDEICVAYHWCGATGLARKILGAAVPSIHAFPEVWSDLHELATNILTGAQASDDPGLDLWRAIETSQFDSSDSSEVAPKTGRARLALGLGVAFKLSNFLEPEAPDLRLAAASELDAPNYELLFEDGPLKVYLRIRPGEILPWLMIQAPTATALELLDPDGHQTPLQHPYPDQWEHVAGVGEWTVIADGRRTPIFLE